MIGYGYSTYTLSRWPPNYRPSPCWRQHYCTCPEWVHALWDPWETGFHVGAPCQQLRDAHRVETTPVRLVRRGCRRSALVTRHRSRQVRLYLRHAQ